MTLLKPCQKCGEQEEFKNRPKIRMEQDRVSVECPCGEKSTDCDNFDVATWSWNRENEIPVII